MAIIDRYAGFVIDLDGVVVRGGEPLRGAVQFLRRAVKNDLAFVLVTNNATRTPEDWSALLERDRVTIPPERVLTTAHAAGWLLAADPPPRCLVIGEQPLVTALSEAGAQIVDEAEDADTVVVGYDRELKYDALRRAASAIVRGARFVGTNPEPLLIGDETLPGTGPTLAYLRAATDVAAEVVGKPQTPLLELAAERLNVGGRVLVVGDQIGTDVVAATRMGWDSALVMTGVSSWPSLIGAPGTPDWVVPDLSDLDGPEPPLIRRATEKDLDGIVALLDDASFDTDQAGDRLANTLVAVAPEDTIVGTISWVMVGSAAHLRGITVDRAERGHGTGSHLVVRALDALTQEDADWVYLLTPGADELFEKLGFWRVHRDRVPQEILDTAQFGAEQSGARALVRRLR